MKPRIYGLLTPRRVALMWLFLMTGCGVQLRQLPPPSQPAQPSFAAACTGWTGATMAWPVFAQLIAQELEQQRVKACVAPPPPPTAPTFPSEK
jgi:hypothetical protein